MQIISSHNGLLQTLAGNQLRASSTERSFVTGINPIDQLAPMSKWNRGAIHELLSDPAHGAPRFFATVIACGATGNRIAFGGTGIPACDRTRYSVADFSSEAICIEKYRAASQIPARRNATGIAPVSSGVIVWSDPARELYPPALAMLGIDLNHLILLRPKTRADELWAIAECLRSSAVAVTIASPRQALSQIDARRLQLAAERGGGVGILLRPTGRASSHYAAVTRWVVAPARGERTIQRWKIQLLHGHGGRVGENVFLEYSRENHSVRAIEKLPDRQTAPAIATRSA